MEKINIVIELLSSNQSDIKTLALDILPIIIAVISIVISVYSSKKSERTTLESVYYSKIFDEILIEIIPKAWSRVSYVSNKFVDADSALEDAVNELKKKIVYYELRNEKIYDALLKEIIYIDEQVVKHYMFEMSLAEYVNLKANIKKSIEKIYRIVGAAYLGKKFR